MAVAAGTNAFWMQSGLWLVPLVVLLDAAPALLAVTTLALWFSHRVASLYTLVRTPQLRAIVRARRHVLFTAPLVVGVAVFALILVPEELVGVSFRARAGALATLFLLFQHYHGAMQHYGVLSMYGAGKPATGRTRALERSFCIVVGALVVLVGQIGHGAAVVHASFLHDWNALVPKSFGVSIAILATIGMLWADQTTQRSSTARSLYVVSIGLQAALAFVLAPLPFMILWLAQHWLVALGLSARITKGATGRSVPFFVILVGGSFLVSAVLRFEDVAPALPAILGPFANLRHYPYVIPLTLATMHALFFAHMLWDRTLFRMADPVVRAAVGPLLMPGVISSTHHEPSSLPNSRDDDRDGGYPAVHLHGERQAAGSRRRAG